MADQSGVRSDVQRTPRSLRSLVLTAGPVVAMTAGIGATATQAWHLMTTSLVGGDFVPLRHAAQALVSGTSVYGDPTFVYPPSAAVPLLITGIGTEAFASMLWGALGIIALLAAAAQIARQAGREWRVMIGGLAVFVLVVGCAATDSLDLGNLSVLLAPVAITAMVAMGRGRWLLGCGVVCASLLIKPLLLPLLAVPLLYGHWRELVRAAVPTGLVLGASMVLIPGGRQFPRILAYDFSGTNLHAGNARNNLSIAGWLEAHSVGHETATALRALAVIVVVAIAAATLAGARQRGRRPASVAQSGNVAMATVLLSGSISEVHFLVILLATSLLQFVLQPSRRTATCLLPGIAMLGIMTAYRTAFIGSAAPQTWYVLAELALLLGNAAEVFAASARRPAVASTVPASAELRAT